MTVIAMTREMGSLGKDVAVGLAENLDLQIVHHDLVESDIANRMQIKEHDVHRYLEGNPSVIQRWRIDKQCLFKHAEREVYELANKGNVIIRGWGATELLKKVPHVIRLRVCASMRFRAEVLKERHNLRNLAVARREIEANDAAHARALSKFSNPDWENPLNYDLVLNSEHVSIDAGVELVKSLVSSGSFNETRQSREALLDLALRARVCNELESRKELRSAIRHIDVFASGSEIILYGAVKTKAQGADIYTTARRIDGVRSVTNNLYTPRVNRHMFWT